MKRVLRFVLVLIVGATLGLGALAFFMEEVKLSNSTLIMARPNIAWTTASDTQRLGEWIGDLENASVLPNNRLRLDFVSGRLAIVTITNTTPNTSIRMTIDTDREHAVGTMTFESTGGSTLLTHSLQVRGKSFARRAVLPLILPAISLRHMAMLDNLEALVEQRPSTSPDSVNGGL